MIIYYTIYQTTNLINGKIYIGKHQTTNLDDGYLGSGTRFNHALKKYGKENFKKEILFIFDNVKEMNEKESELVNESFVRRPDTYNITLGGNGSWHHIHTPEGKNLTKTIMIKRYGVDHIFNDPNCRANNILSVKENHKKHVYTYIHELPDFDDINKKGCLAAQSELARTKRINSLRMINHQQGNKNSQYGTRWIHNLELQISKKIPKDVKLPDGWKEGRKLKFEESNQR